VFFKKRIKKKKAKAPGEEITHALLDDPALVFF
jgi:hypothetical protein